jgi:hypothetical protein
VVVTGSARIAVAVSAQVRALKPVSALQALNDFVQLVVMAIFIRPRLYWLPAAVPFLKLGQTIFPRTVTLRRMSGVKAGALRDWRARLTAGNTARAATAAFYGRRLSLPLPHGAAHPYLRLPILARDKNTRDRIHAASERRGLGLGVGYPTPINEIPEIRGLFGGQRFPAARLVADLLLTLPTHHWLSENDRRAIAQCVETNELAVRRSRQMAERAVSVS